MFHEAGERLEDRVEAAAVAGFRKAEIFTTGNRDVPSLARALADNGVELWSTVADPRTRLVESETHGAFRDLFRKAAEDARALGCGRVVVASGPGVPWMKRPEQLRIVGDAVAGIVPIAEELDVIVMLEAVNTRVDHPGVLFAMTEDAVAVAEQVASPRVRLLYDMYHSIVEGEEPAEILPSVIDMVEHVQIADAPGRGEPGSGAIDWKARLHLLEEVGYRGVIGVECSPTSSSTGEALAYIRALCSQG
jgi:hydroxypyruvate isomerase